MVILAILRNRKPVQPHPNALVFAKGTWVELAGIEPASSPHSLQFSEGFDDERLIAQNFQSPRTMMSRRQMNKEN
jgi:hypothetical protein